MRMNLFKNKEEQIHGYSDEDLINIGRAELMLNPKYKVTIIQDVENNEDSEEDVKPFTREVKELIPFTDKECRKKGLEIIANKGLKPFSYSQDELNAQQAEQARINLIGQTQQLLNDNDYRQIKAISGMYSKEKKKAVLDYMEALRKVYRQAENGILTELPIQTF